MVLGAWTAGYAVESGSPFFTNFGAEDYRAQERNFDVVCDAQGNVFFANFQGVLHYDNSRWQVYMTPDISRISALLSDGKGGVYVGGYNTMGVLQVTPQGGLAYGKLRGGVADSTLRTGEILKIVPRGDGFVFVGEQRLAYVVRDSLLSTVEVPESTVRSAFFLSSDLYVQTEDNTVYRYSDAGLQQDHSAAWGGSVRVTCTCSLESGVVLVGTEKGLKVFEDGHLSAPGNAPLFTSVAVSDLTALPDGSVAVASLTDGLYHMDARYAILTHVSESSGFCNNVVNALATDGCGTLWCATAQGVAAVNMPSFFSRYTYREGLAGEVLCLQNHKGTLYAGTYQGLYYLDASQGIFLPIPEVNLSCWNLYVDSRQQLLALSAAGLFCIEGAQARRLSDAFSMSMAQLADSQYIVAEVDGLYRVSGLSPYRKEKMSDIAQVSRMERVEDDYWMENVFGELFRYGAQTGVLTAIGVQDGLTYAQGNKLFVTRGSVYALGRGGILKYQPKAGRFETDSLLHSTPRMGEAWWPGLIEQADDIFYVTRGDGQRVMAFADDGCVDEVLSQKLAPLFSYSVRLIYPDDKALWLAGSFGVIKACFDLEDPAFAHTPQVYFRSLRTQDSVIWNGYFSDRSLMEREVVPLQPRLQSRLRGISVSFGAVTTDSYQGIEYAYLLSPYDTQWSDWSAVPNCEYRRLPWRKYTLQVKARDAFGRESEPKTLSFSIEKPVFLKWYSMVIYVLLWSLLMYLFFKWRTYKVIKEKERLEAVVTERTSEVRKQRDEIRSKSEALESTLEQLEKAQSDLVRQEKMAMVGKLTKGLVDRILNPINYINNFSLLTAGFAKEIKENIEGVKEHMKEDTYDDSMDLFDMMHTNLQKISQHGQSVSRILKTMEEMLRERKHVFTKLDLVEMCRICVDVYTKQYAAQVQQYGIQTQVLCQEESLVIDALNDMLSKAVNGMVLNSFYALVKKAERTSYSPELRLEIKRVPDDKVALTVYDNGPGIEATILPVLFDPYFTTKPTAEAAGIGLYLTKDVIQSHGGTIEVASVKGEYTLFTVTLPIKQTNKETNE